MPQQTSVILPGGQEGVVIYPDGKRAVKTVYQQNSHDVVVHYDPPSDGPDLANGVNGMPDFFIVPEAAVEMAQAATSK